MSDQEEHPYGPPPPSDPYPQPGYQQPPYPQPPYPQPSYPQPTYQGPYRQSGYTPPSYPAHPFAPAYNWVPARPPFPHPEPRPYHLMYRTWTYAWWRPVVGILLLLAGMLIVVPLLLLPVLVVGVLIQGGSQGFLDEFLSAGTGADVTPAGLLYLNLSLAGLILWTWGLIRFLHQMRPRWLASVRPRLRWRLLFVCLGLALVALIAQFVVGLLVPEGGSSESDFHANPVTGTTVAMLLIVLVTTPLQCAGEEYAFRGYLLQALGALVRNRWVAVVLTALLFAVAHLQFAPPLFLDRFLFGLIAAWLVIRTGGLEAGIALHVLNNYLALSFGILFSDLSSALDPKDVSWWNLPVSLTQSLVYAGLVAWVAGRMRVQTLTRPPEAPLSAREDPVLTGPTPA